MFPYQSAQCVFSLFHNPIWFFCMMYHNQFNKSKDICVIFNLLLLKTMLQQITWQICHFTYFYFFIGIDELPSIEVIFIYILTSNTWVSVSSNLSNKKILKILLLQCLQWSGPATLLVSSHTTHPWFSALQPLGFFHPSRRSWFHLQEGLCTCCFCSLECSPHLSPLCLIKSCSFISSQLQDHFFREASLTPQSGKTPLLQRLVESCLSFSTPISVYN